MSSVALLTGATGQDGSYLAELLLDKGYEVHAIVRRSSTPNISRIDHILNHPSLADSFHLHYGDISDGEQINKILQTYQPDEIYHLGAQSHVKVSFESAEYTGNITGLSTTRILEGMRNVKKKTRMYQASSSEMFGGAASPQNEESSFIPRSPYACAKLYGYWMVKNYREGYNFFASNGILFNHESPRRGENFVTRKITIGAASIVAGKAKMLALGNLDATRDWGFAPEYVEGMYQILSHTTADDFVLATGKTHSVREFVDEVFAYIDLDVDAHVTVDPRYFRPTEVESLLGDARKAKGVLGWKPRVSFKDLVKIMVDADMRKMGLSVIGEGDEILAKHFPNKWWMGD
ncbi:MAG: GDP-mannose 4,6-dehydratase [Euryarchaeota archaeon]|nr:GDP-mannose 4,6-dehydratase [Euryarchaeota archaeon]